MARCTHDTMWISQSGFPTSPSSRADGAGPKWGTGSSYFPNSSRLSGMSIAIFMPLVSQDFFVDAQVFPGHLAPGKNRERGFAPPVRRLVKLAQIGCDLSDGPQFRKLQIFGLGIALGGPRQIGEEKRQPGGGGFIDGNAAAFKLA